MKFITAALGGILLGANAVSGVTLDLSDNDSIRSAARTVADGMMAFYYGNTTDGIPGLLGEPYYWWEAGAMMNAMIDFWYYTGDPSYNDVVMEAMMHQVGPEANFEPPNQTKSLGNDDQAFWAIAAMSAAEVKFPNPPDDQPQWLALAQAVFNRQAPRWDDTTCAGGLKWQIFAFNNGYNYKNSISNGCFFNLAARLGAYTGNDTYFEWAARAWDWSEAVGLVSNNYQVFDGTDDNKNCTDMNHIQWSYNSGVYLLGAATMWNQTEDQAEREEWAARVSGILNAAGVFFYDEPSNVMYEVACEPQMNCNVDQLSFKAYFSRWLAATTKVAPWTHDLIMPLLQASAEAAATSCTGGANGNQCGTQWHVGEWDRTYGVGQQMCALEVIQSNLIDTVDGPVGNNNKTGNTGGISEGDPTAGTGSEGIAPPPGSTNEISSGDKAGAGILTALIIITILGGAW
ncbi:hypothetical protein MBLNU230_g3507t1 [Neophaeotheca triangularis]